jgi:hypothetical protein
VAGALWPATLFHSEQITLAILFASKLINSTLVPSANAGELAIGLSLASKATHFNMPDALEMNSHDAVPNISLHLRILTAPLASMHICSAVADDPIISMAVKMSFKRIVVSLRKN